MRIGALLFLLLWFFVGAKSQSLSLTVRPDTNAMLIGDHLHVDINARYPDKSRLFWPQWKDTLGTFEVLQVEKRDSSLTGGMVNAFVRLTLTAFDSGAHIFPALPFSLKKTYDNDAENFLSEPFSISVQTIPIDTTQDIRPIKAPVSAPLTLKEALPFIIGIILLGSLIGFIVYYLFFRKKPVHTAPAPPQPIIAPHVLALQQIEELERQDLWRQGKSKDFYVQLTEILRIYMNGRFGLQALASTTDEILYDLSVTHQVKENWMNRLRNLLVQADMVKFAKYTPQVSEFPESLQTAREFVINHIPPAVETQALKEK